MRAVTRFAVLAVAGALGLAFAGGAFATSKIEIFQSAYSLGGTVPLDLTVSQADADAAPAKAQILVPAGYQVTLTQAPGSTVGSVDAVANAVVQGTPVKLPLTGQIAVAKPSDYTASATKCTGSATHQAVWILELSVSGNTLPVPVYVDAAGPPGVAATIQVCLPSPYIPPSSGGAQFGASLLTAKLHLVGVFTGPASAADYLWRLIVTPYVVGTGTPNPPATVEARAVVPYPYKLTLKRAKSKGKTVKLTGRLAGSSGPISGAPVSLFTVATQIDSQGNPFNALTFLTRAGTTKSNGSFAKTLRATRRARRVLAAFGPRDVTGSACGAPVLAPAGCVSATQSAVRSGILRIPAYKPPKKKRHH